MSMSRDSCNGVNAEAPDGGHGARPSSDVNMEAASVSAPPSPIETEVRRIRTLLERSQFGPALEAAHALRAQVPENRDVLYMLALGPLHHRPNLDRPAP
jgi:hypothetical protein